MTTSYGSTKYVFQKRGLTLPPSSLLLRSFPPPFSQRLPSANFVWALIRKNFSSCFLVRSQLDFNPAAINDIVVKLFFLSGCSAFCPIGYPRFKTTKWKLSAVNNS